MTEVLRPLREDRRQTTAARARRESAVRRAVYEWPAPPAASVSDEHLFAWTDRKPVVPVAEPTRSERGLPYSPRCLLDQRLAERLTAAADHGGRVVVVGASATGKSRSLWVALRSVLGERPVIAMADPLYATGTDPVAAVIETLAHDFEMSAPPVVVVDDAHDHIRALTLGRDQLDQLMSAYPGVVVAVTAISSELSVLRRTGQGVGELLLADAIEFPDHLDAVDTEAAATIYPSLAAHPWLARATGAAQPGARVEVSV